MECFYALLLEHSQIMWRYGQTKTYNVKQYCERGVGGGDSDGCSGDGSGGGGHHTITTTTNATKY